ncbi:uncharacterized protein Z518_02975 [Rhinocladiella mackenziei CBS 650.93]|uniref:Uncharacterized protein n=1 Tax=Rhinocladiella mackenziei CBS 650.93 TaxID=1442369 RepID=A0A0D2IQR6_9EURO|nr:uncharacterized protein Z518_02975 [Rhinocladiella mackenziei CBS 650.93]KIX08319.1 hypothetical protein Z518_02975 [Rhinocladiella mackenziei CBS 650.93]
MEELLQENNPDRILLGLVSRSIGDVFVANADDDTFSQAICALHPDHFIVPYRELHHHLKPSLEVQPRYRLVTSLEERIDTFIKILDTLVVLRQEKGYIISLEVYRHLLHCAAAAGHRSLAKNVFRKFMPEANVKPDLECFNYFMEALNWNNAYGRHERYHLRVIPYNLHRRSSPQEYKGFTGHEVASPTHPGNPNSIRLEILRTFNELVRQGLQGNEATFCNLMVAMGREGDIASVKSVLKSVWNIDVDALEHYDEEEIESPRFYEDDSPLRPSGRLLFSVVHIFGTNNQISVASMLLDYISRNYNLEIPEFVWSHLLEWTFVLASQDRNYRIQKGFGIGRVSGQAVESLYTVFHSEPFNVKPKIVDLMFRVKVRAKKGMLDMTLEDIRECMRMLEEDRTNVSILYDKMRYHLDRGYYTLFKSGIPAADFLRLRREFVLASLKLECSLQLIIIAVRNVFKEKEWPSAGRGVEWPYRRLPGLVKEWSDFLPNIVPYYTPTGHVTLLGEEHRKGAIRSANSNQMTKAGSMRIMFDSYSPARLLHAADFVYRKPTGLTAFYEEAEADSESVYTDWVSEIEKEQRTQRMEAKDSKIYFPAADYRMDEWRPWSKHIGSWP